VSQLGDIGFCYHPDIAGARALTERLAASLPAGTTSWVTPLPRADGGEALDPARVAASDLLVCVGGDGTVLQASGVAAANDTPIFGVRMGRLGFLAESTEGEAEAALTAVATGGGRIEARAMVQARIGDGPPQHALNEVVIGRPNLGRTVTIGVRIGGVLLAEYRADGVIVSSASGSTGYALAVGGPILSPTSPDVIIAAVAPHLSHGNALVVPGDEEVTLEVERDAAVMILDGRDEQPVPSGTVVRVTRSPRVARFVRLGGEHQFYANLASRLGWLRRDHQLPARRDDR